MSVNCVIEGESRQNGVYLSKCARFFQTGDTKL
jgi:hypothetical protein